MERAISESLKLLGKIASSPALGRLGVKDQLENLLYHGSKASVGAASSAFARARPILQLVKPDRMRGGAPAERPSLFDLTFTEAQELVHDTMQRFALEQLRPAARAADETGEVSAKLLDECHELGLTHLTVPEAAGGAGEARSITTNVIVTEDLARGDMSLALAALAPLGVVHALVDFGTAEQQGNYLPAFVGERFYPAAMALLEPRLLQDPHHLVTRAVEHRGDYVLSGEKALVPLAGAAEVFLVLADLSGSPQAFLVERGAPGLSIEPEPAMGLRAARLGRVRLDRVRVAKAARLGGEEGVDAERLIDLSRIAWGALSVGAASAVVDYVKEFVVDRKAFGEPIAHRQSVAFTVATMATELDGMRLLVQRAASRAEHGLSFRREAYLARLFCAEKGMQIATDGVQMLGGAGFVQDHPVELWYRQLRAVGVYEGGILV